MNTKTMGRETRKGLLKGGSPWGKWVSPDGFSFPLGEGFSSPPRDSKPPGLGAGAKPLPGEGEISPPAFPQGRGGGAWGPKRAFTPPPRENFLPGAPSPGALGGFPFPRPHRHHKRLGVGGGVSITGGEVFGGKGGRPKGGLKNPGPNLEVKILKSLGGPLHPGPHEFSHPKTPLKGPRVTTTEVRGPTPAAPGPPDRSWGQRGEDPKLPPGPRAPKEVPRALFRGFLANPLFPLFPLKGGAGWGPPIAPGEVAPPN